MEPHSLEELRTVDELSTLYGPQGFGGHLLPEQAAAFLQELVGSADLAPAVPEATVAEFDRLRRVFAYGVLCYDVYTVVRSAAPFVLELALGERFISYYDGRVPFETRSGIVEVEAERFSDVYRARKTGRARGRGVRLIASPGRAVRFRGSLTDLLAWARVVELLRGHRSRRMEPLLVLDRDRTAHPSGQLTLGPLEASRMIRDVAELINQLWGVPTDGGRLYPTPVRREIVVIGRDGERRSAMLADAFGLATGEPLAEYTVARAVWADPELLSLCPVSDRTVYPTTVLFGPAPADAARLWLQRHAPEGDAVGIVDRRFCISGDEPWTWPLRLDAFRSLDGDARGGRWLVVVADHPTAAVAHVRHGHIEVVDGICDACAVRVLADGGYDEALAGLAAADVTGRVDRNV